MSDPTTNPERTQSAKDLAYWERFASKYDLSLRLLRRPLPRMLELIGDAANGAGRVLEVAAGTGLVTPTLAEQADEVIATDYAAAMLERLNAKTAEQGLSNVQCEQADIYALPYESRSFDVVVAANVLHIVPDLPAALEALKTMLKPGGLLIAPTFCHDETRVSWLMSRLLAITAFPGQRRFTATGLSEALSHSGLAVSRTETLPGLIPIGYVEGVLPSLTVQLLSFAECPNREPAREALRESLEEYPEATFQEFDVNADETPEHLRGWGSPTILINGKDVAGQQAAGSSCRIYDDHIAGNRGVPSKTSIRRALERATK